jgi:hypothetical protein
MMEAARTSETSVDNYFARKYIPEDKSELVCVIFKNPVRASKKAQHFTITNVSLLTLFKEITVCNGIKRIA